MGSFRGGAGAMYGDNADGDYAIDEYGDGTGTMQSTEDGYEMGEMGDVDMGAADGDGAEESKVPLAKTMV